jgi:hypothetical protein
MTEDAREYQCTVCGTDVPAEARICPKCGANFDEPGDSPTNTHPPESLSPDWVQNIEQRLKNLESRVPESEIISHSFWKRAWTVFGYSAATEMVIVLALFLFALLVRACVG